MATRTRSKLGAAVALLLAISSGVAGAQTGLLRPGLAVLTPIPVGPVSTTRDIGVGGTVSLSYDLPAARWLGLRVEATGFAPATRIDREQFVTGSSALFADVGPQVSAPLGSSQAYAITAAGVSRLWAWSKTPGGNTPGGVEISRETRTGGANFAWSAGGGIIAPLSAGGIGSRVALDLSVRFYDLGRARYSTDVGDQILTITRRTTLVAPSIGLRWHY
jgi:hypothetical protein